MHGGWAPGVGRPGRLIIWAEDPALPLTSTSRARSRPHPFAAPSAALAEFLGEVVTAGVAAPVHVELPGTGRGPLPSPETGADAATRGLKLGAWTVPALSVPADAAVAALGLLAEPDPDGRWIAGASLRYLSLLAGYACDLARRGRMLPQLVIEAGVPAARWRPVLTGSDAATFKDFAAGMPPVVRAVDGGRQLGRVIRDALDSLLDGAARSILPDRIMVGQRPGPKAPLPDRWLGALTADPALPGAPDADVRDLRRALDDWMRAANEANGPIRVSFRLIEPDPDAILATGTTPAEPDPDLGRAIGTTTPAEPDPDLGRAAGTTAPGEPDLPPAPVAWSLEFALQSAEDPGLYLPARDLWAGERFPGLPQRPDETLLAGLGRAIRLFPVLHIALLERRPAAMSLTTGEAYEFLRQTAPLLQAAGFGVQLPAWAGRKGVGLKLTTRSKPKSKAGASRAAADSGFGLEQLVDFRLDLVIGDAMVSAEELAELARAKIPLVRVRGQWVELDDRQLKAALKAVSRRHEGELTAGEILQQVADGGEEDLPLVEVDADGDLGDLLSGQAAERLDPLPTPEGFQGALRPYQERGLSWLHFLGRLGLGGILADDMGLGKTAQTLSLLLTDQPSKTLLVCPMSLVSNWFKEAGRFAPSLRVYVHHGGTRLRGVEFDDAVADADLVLTTYGTALRDLETLRTVTWTRVVCDEAQAIKNSGTRQSQAVRAIPARTRLALTGTPVENHLAELWSIMDFCNPGLLGPAKRFRRRFQEPIESRQDEDATAALKRATGPFVLRRLKTDKSIISDLPEKNEMKVWCSLTPEQATLYQAVVEDMMAEIESSEGIQRRGNVLAAMMKLKQVCNHPAHLLKDGSRLPGRSGKLARLEELADEIISDGDKALVFTQYAEWGSLMQPYLAAHTDRPVLWLHGGLSKARRDELVERFQTDDEPMIFLLSLKAAGTGLNLTAANHVVHFDRWWNPAVEDQATDRAFRIGQSRNVQVRKFICTGTLEEKIDAMIERKKALASSVVGTGEEWITDLSTTQLRELFALDPAAVR